MVEKTLPQLQKEAEEDIKILIKELEEVSQREVAATELLLLSKRTRGLLDDVDLKACRDVCAEKLSILIKLDGYYLLLSN